MHTHACTLTLIFFPRIHTEIHRFYSDKCSIVHAWDMKIQIIKKVVLINWWYGMKLITFCSVPIVKSWKSSVTKVQYTEYRKLTKLNFGPVDLVMGEEGLQK